MNLLLDTHVLLWWLADAPELSESARRAIQDTTNVSHVSFVSIWEIEVKRALGKLTIPDNYLDVVARQGFREITARWAHAQELSRLPHNHSDPFDRLLVAQARVENLTLVTTNAEILKYDVMTLS
jgi:PIN domain nuclease of toxin-antitoxin system